MTRRISLVAVCCSRASVVSRFRSSSVNSRTFSIAITAWAAKVWSSAICVSEKGDLPLGHRDGADRIALSEHGHGQRGAEARRPYADMIVLVFWVDIDVNDGPSRGSPGRR